MEKRNIQVFYIALFLTVLCKCRTLQTDLSIPEKKIPTSFINSTDTNTVAKVNWKDYFDDELLVQLIDTALRSNFDLQIALQRIEIARSGVRFAQSELYPTINGNLLAGSTRYGKFTESGQGNATTPYPDDPDRIIPNPVPDLNIGLSTAWEIDIWGKLRNQRKAALANYLSSFEGKNFVVSNLVANVAIAYYELQALDSELEILKNTIQKQQEALDIVKIQKETGRTNDLIIQQFQSLVLNSQVLEKETIQKISETENKINFILGRFPQRIERKKETVLFSEVPAQISSGIPSQLLLYRPDIREAEYQLISTKFDLKSAKAAFLPNLTIVAGFGMQSFNPMFLLNPVSLGYNVASGLIAPIINKNALHAQFNKAKASQISAMYHYQKTILNGFFEVVNELSNIKSLEEIISLKKQQSEVLIQSVETSTELYLSARANYLEVLIAQQNALQTQLELISVNKRQRIAFVNIYKALGGGW